MDSVCSASDEGEGGAIVSLWQQVIYCQDNVHMAYDIQILTARRAFELQRIIFDMINVYE